MKKHIATGLALLGFAGVANAAPPGFLFPGGARQDSVIHAPNTSLDGKTVTQWGAAIDANTATAAAAVPKSWIGANSTSSVTGVAPLDSNGNSTAPFLAGGPSRVANGEGNILASFAPVNTGTGQDNWTPNTSLIKPNSVIFGGARSNYATSTDDFNTDGQLWVLGQTDGSNSLGCLFCLIQTTNSITNVMAGLSGTWANGVSGVANYGEADAAASYIQTQNTTGTLTLNPSSVSSDEIILSTPLTTAQMSRIHHGMYVMTNFIDSTLTVPSFSSSTSLPAKNFYASTVNYVVDSTHILVNGWAVPGSGNSTSGQVPDITKLDTVWTNFGTPTVGIGSFTNNMFMNWRYDIGSQNSWNRNFENEWDFTDTSGVAGGHRKRLLTITDQSGVRPTSDSWVFNLNTIQYPVQIHMETRPDGFGIQSNSFMTKGNLGVGSVGAIWEMAESAAFADSADNMRLVSAVSKDSSDTGYTGASIRLGLIPNGTQGTWSTPQSQLIFDPLLPGQTANSTGTLALAGFAGIGMAVDGNSNTLLPNGHYMQFQPTGWASGTTAPILQAASASQLNVRDTGGNGIMLDTYNLNVGGTATLSSAKVTGNLTADSQVIFSNGVFFSNPSTTELDLLNSSGNNVTLSTSRFREALATPSSSSAACTAGEFTDDANFHYVCVAANMWKRVTLSSF